MSDLKALFLNQSELDLVKFALTYVYAHYARSGDDEKCREIEDLRKRLDSFGG